MPAAQFRRMPEWALGLLLISGGWWVGLGSKAAHEATGATRLKPVADEAGRGYIPMALAEALVPRMHVAARLLSLRRAQPAPPPPYTPRPAGRAQRDSVGAGCGRAAGQVSWRRVGSVGRFDRLWHTDGRPFVRGAHQGLWQLGR